MSVLNQEDHNSGIAIINLVAGYCINKTITYQVLGLPALPGSELLQQCFITTLVEGRLTFLQEFLHYFQVKEIQPKQHQEQH